MEQASPNGVSESIIQSIRVDDQAAAQGGVLHVRARLGVPSGSSKCLGARAMNHPITLPPSVIKRLEKLAAKSRRSPDSIVSTAVKERIEYEEWFDKQVAAGSADLKAGRVISYAEAVSKLERARNARKKTG
jgi:predicted transcriptional regulator